MTRTRRTKKKAINLLKDSKRSKMRKMRGSLNKKVCYLPPFYLVRDFLLTVCLHSRDWRGRGEDVFLLQGETVPFHERGMEGARNRHLQGQC